MHVRLLSAPAWKQCTRHMAPLNIRSAKVFHSLRKSNHITYIIRTCGSDLLGLSDLLALENQSVTAAKTFYHIYAFPSLAVSFSTIRSIHEHGGKMARPMPTHTLRDIIQTLQTMIAPSFILYIPTQAILVRAACGSRITPEPYEKAQASEEICKRAACGSNTRHAGSVRKWPAGNKVIWPVD